MYMLFYLQLVLVNDIHIPPTLVYARTKALPTYMYVHVYVHPIPATYRVLICIQVLTCMTMCIYTCTVYVCAHDVYVTLTLLFPTQ